MSDPNNTPSKPAKLTNKEKHNRESIKKTVDREYDVISKKDTEEPNEEIHTSELNEPSVMIERTDVPRTNELETVGKPYGSVGSVGVQITDKKTVAHKVEQAKMGKVVEDDYVNLPDSEKVMEDEAK